MIGLIALAVMLSGGVGIVTFPADPGPSPTEEKVKGKNPESPTAEPDSMAEKKDDKGGK